MLKSLFNSSSRIFMVIFIITISFSQLELKAQSQSIDDFEKQFEDDWTVEYIMGGILVAGLIYWAIESSSEEEFIIEENDMDSTNTTSAEIRNNTEIRVPQNQFVKISKFINDTPFKPYIALKQNKILMNNKKALHVGFVYNF